MSHYQLGLITFLVVVLELSLCFSGHSHHHVHHRIHVPHKVQTIFHTKIIKVPEHHHYIHEKEKPKLIKVPEHHHYFHEKEKEKLVDIHSLHHGGGASDEFDHHKLHHDFEHHKEFDFGDGGHNIFKKHAPSHLYKKKSIKTRRVH